MRQKNKWWALCVAALVLAGSLVLLRVVNIHRVLPAAAELHEELGNGKYYSLIDSAGKELFTTGIALSVGDEFISEHGTIYRVNALEGLTARCAPVGTTGQDVSQVTAAEAGPTTAGNIAIYHTHSDEAYEPTQGADSIPARGGVMAVGESLKAALLQKGVKVIHDTSSHEPHDAGSYQRSRRTALRLLAQRPSALIDLHRDAGPASTYRRTIAGQDAAGMTIVIGKQNPKYAANMDFAQRLKSVADKMYPGLIRGILTTKGNFNQDLSERALLIEVGTEKNSMEEAQKGAGLLANVIPQAVGAAATGTHGAPAGSGARSAAWVIVVLALIGVAAYLVISMGGWKEAMSKLNLGGGNRGPKPDGSDRQQ